ncbi:hypothetical protein [Paenarthrobacter nitroguajacolicus]
MPSLRPAIEMKFNVERNRRVRTRTSARRQVAAKPATDWRLAITATGAPEQDLRRDPLLMKHWKYLWRHEYVELRRGDTVVGSGYVDESTNDARIIWIQLANGLGRIMIHDLDGIDIWRVDPRINGRRSQD